MANERIRLKFDEESMQDMYLDVKISFMKLLEITFLLGTLASDFVRKKEIPKDHLESAYLKARHILVTVLQALPESATDEDLENYILSGDVLNNITNEKLFSMIDNLTFNVIRAASDGKASASTVNSDVADLILSDSAANKEEVEDLLDLVDNAPVTKLDA